MKARDIAQLVSESFWKTCYKFTSERHPYEKAVSLAYYNFATERNGEGDFNEFPDLTVKGGGYRIFNHYTIRGKVVVNDFIRYESLAIDLMRISQRIGFMVPEVLPQEKAVSN